MKHDVVIVGAGVLGISLAFHLSRHGVQTCVLEKEPSYGLHASGKNAGMFRQLYRHPQLTSWAYNSRLEWPEESKAEAFRRTGSIIANRRLPGHHDFLFEEINLPLGPKTVPAVYTEDDGLLDPHLYTSSLMQLRDKKYAHFVYNCSVAAIELLGERRWRTTCADGKVFESTWLVNCAGAWINSFLEPQLQAEAMPYARHLFVSSGWPKDFLETSGYLWEENAGWYTRRWDSEKQLVSVCDKLPVEVPEEYTPSGNIHYDAADKLYNALPEIAGGLCLERSWHCFRTYTEDSLPIWGEDPLAPGLFWLAAFGGFGMSTSFAACMNAAEAIIGENPKVSQDFSPRRSLSERKLAYN